MPQKIDYTRVSNIIETILNKEVVQNYTFITSEIFIDQEKRTIKCAPLYGILRQDELIKAFLPTTDSDDISVDLFVISYAHAVLFKSTADPKSFVEIKSYLQADAFYALYSDLEDEISFYSLAYYLVSTKNPWSGFVQGFDVSDWEHITLLSNLLPFSMASTKCLLPWIESIVKAQEGDGALGLIGDSIYEWALRQPDNGDNVEKNILVFANNLYANRFFVAVLKGLREKQKKEISYYQNLLEPSVAKNNAFPILFALAAISQNSDADRQSFFKLAMDKLKNCLLLQREFLTISYSFNFYNKDVFEVANGLIDSSDDVQDQATITEYLRFAPSDIDNEWYCLTGQRIIVKNKPEIKHSLDRFLIQLADTNLSLAYDLFTVRIKTLGGHLLLERGLTVMIRKDANIFQTRFVTWLTTHDMNVHSAILHITSISSLDKSLFYIYANIYEKLLNKEKLFAAYKIVGYVYSMEVLQALLLSLIDSIKDAGQALSYALNFILQDYLVYNYRSTLKEIRKRLEEPTLNSFAKDLYQYTCNYFDNYFNGLRSIEVNKEITPYREHSQLWSFYQRKIFSEIPKKAEQKSLANRFFKTAKINAGKWAIFREGELVHQPSPLGNVSVTAEFPSGQKLDPIYQEFIRKKYQTIDFNEINID